MPMTTPPSGPGEQPPDPDRTTDIDRLARFHAAVARVDALIERDNTPHGKTSAEIRERAAMRLARMAEFLATLGDPHLAVPVIHVTGTSGKGSTATAIARMLEASGLRVGLHTSPYLQTPTEKLQLDGRLIDPGDFVALVDRTLAAHDRWVAEGHEALTYGEIWVTMVFLACAGRGWPGARPVDLAVIEVGAGGRFDLTNVVRPAVSVITSVGIDHVLTLGDTIAEIAWHKAGIVKPGAPVVTAVTDPVALAAIDREAGAAGVAVIRVVEGVAFSRTDGPGPATWWRDLTPGGFSEPLPAPPGGYQAGNAAVALATVRAFSTVTGRPIDETAIRAGLAAARIPGRFELIQRPGETDVVLDGAHNAQKVAALMAGIGPSCRATGRRLTVVLGALEAKQIDEMVGLIAPWADAIVTASPLVLAKAGARAEGLADAVRRAGFSGDVHVAATPGVAIERAIAARPREGSPADGVVLVTGSLYLIGNIRGRWYPDDDVTLQRTPWPVDAGQAAPLPSRNRSAETSA